jgi:hypothetical protein
MTRIRFLAWARTFSLKGPDRFWGSPSFLSKGYQGLYFLGVKQLGHETDHSPLSSAKVKNVGGYTSTPPYIFMAWCLVKFMIYLHSIVWVVKHRNNFTFTLLVLLPAIYEGHLKSSWTNLITLSQNFTEVSLSKYLPWQPMHFLQHSTHFLKMCCRPLTTLTFVASELPFHGWKSPEIAWGESWTVWWMF